MGGVSGHLKSFWSERDVLANLEIDLGLYYVTIYIGTVWIARFLTSAFSALFFFFFFFCA